MIIIILLNNAIFVVYRGIQGEDAHNSKRNSQTFDIYSLFEAVSNRDVGKLDSLYQYLKLNRMKLSDTLCEFDTHNATLSLSSWPVCLFPECVTLTDQSYGKTVLMKALLHLKDGKNETVEKLIDVSEKLGDVEKLVNLAYTSDYYKGTRCVMQNKLEQCSMCLCVKKHGCLSHVQ